jgi:hypothetical protein
VSQRLRWLKKVPKINSTPESRLSRHQVTRKTVNSKIRKAADKVQRKVISNPYTSKGDKKVLTFGGEEIRFFDKVNEDLNFSQLDSLQLEDYDSIEILPTIDRITPNDSSFGKEDQDLTSRLAIMNHRLINAQEGNGNITAWSKTVNKDQDLLGILSPSGLEESSTIIDPRLAAVDVGGNCAYCAVSDQALGKPKYHLALRAATAHECWCGDV